MSTSLARGELAILLDGSEDDLAVVDLKETISDLAKPDRFADQCLAQEQPLAAPFDLAVAAHPAHDLVDDIVRLTQSSAIGPRRGSRAAVADPLQSNIEKL
jgi:hypothetical protein